MSLSASVLQMCSITVTLTFNLKNNSGYLLVMINLLPKIVEIGPSVLQIFIRNCFAVKCHCDTFELVTQKKIGAIYWSWPTGPPSLRNLSWSILQIWIGNSFAEQQPCDIDLWPDNPKNNSSHLLVMTNLRKFIYMLKMIIIKTIH